MQLNPFAKYRHDNKEEKTNGENKNKQKNQTKTEPQQRQTYPDIKRQKTPNYTHKTTATLTLQRHNSL